MNRFWRTCLVAASAAAGVWIMQGDVSWQTLLAAALASGAAVVLLFPASRTTRKSLAGNHQHANMKTEADVALADALTEPIILFGNNADIRFANRAAHETFGNLRNGASFRLRFRTPQVLDALERAFTEKQTVVTDYIERSPLERHYRLTIISMGDSDTFLASFQDRTDIWRMEKMRSDFIANASHELRTPLASISGFVETLSGAARNDPEARARFLDIMKAQTERMSRLIDDLLSLSRLEMNHTLPSRKTIDLPALLERVIGSLRKLAAENNVSLELCYGDAPPTISGEEDEIFQVFENLVVNACKYGNGGGQVEITAHEAEIEGQSAITVSVRDYGQGIAAEHLPRLTERFYRVDAAQSRLQKGTGLGLAIVKHIIVRHRGRLKVESEIGRGSSFSVTFPVGADQTLTVSRVTET